MAKQLPSSSEIIALLLKHKRLSLHELAYHLAIHKNEEHDFKQLLKKMASHKEIKIAADNIISLTVAAQLCRYQANKDGRGGLAIDLQTKESIIIPAGADNFALDGDEIAVTPNGVTKDGHCQGIVREILRHKIINLVGRAEQYKDKYYLISDNDKLDQYPVIIEDISQAIAMDEIYLSTVIHYPNNEQAYFTVKLIKSIGKLGDDAVFVNRVLLEANTPLEFSVETEKYVAKLANEVSPAEMNGREDLRKLAFVTIDGQDARDFDDAVYCEANVDGSFILSVAIADVAHYVKHGSALDSDAFARSTSIYFPRRVVPMLPEKLSNGLCSLNPNVDRLVMVCHMEISSSGEITDYGVDNAIIHSHYRLTYEQVQEWLMNKDLIPRDIQASLTALNSVYQALLIARRKRGAIDFEGNEPYFEFDAAGNVSSLKPRQRLDSHKLIEECMLAANVSVADFFN